MPLLRYIPETGKWLTYTKEEKKKLPEEEQKKMVYIDGYLKDKLDHGKKRMKKNWDLVFLIDGEVGAGKSTLGMSIGWYMSDTKFTVDHICSGAQDFVEKMAKFERGSTIILDESSLSLSSTNFMAQEFKQLMNIFDVCRQMNFCLILIAPTFFNLTKTISVSRAKFLIHTYEKKGQRGYLSYYGPKKKSQLYKIGKKDYNSYDKPKPNFRGRFPGFKPFENYEEKKKESLYQALTSGKKKGQLSEMDMKKKLLTDYYKRFPDASKASLCRIFNVSMTTVNKCLEPLKDDFE